MILLGRRLCNLLNGLILGLLISKNVIESGYAISVWGYTCLASLGNGH